MATCLTESEQNVPSAVTQSDNGNYKSLGSQDEVPFFDFAANWVSGCNEVMGRRMNNDDSEKSGLQ